MTWPPTATRAEILRILEINRNLYTEWVITRAETEEILVLLGAPDWACKAQRTGDPPQDCDMPFCGCNPAWEVALGAVRESGWRTSEQYNALWDRYLAYNQRNAVLAEALRRAHACATLRPDGTCDGCYVSEVLAQPAKDAEVGWYEGWKGSD